MHEESSDQGEDRPSIALLSRFFYIFSFYCLVVTVCYFFVIVVGFWFGFQFFLNSQEQQDVKALSPTLNSTTENQHCASGLKDFSPFLEGTGICLCNYWNIQQVSRNRVKSKCQAAQRQEVNERMSERSFTKDFLESSANWDVGCTRIAAKRFINSVNHK